MSNLTPPGDLKQFVLTNPLRAYRSATRVTVLLDGELCMRKFLNRKDLDAGFEIVLNPQGRGISTLGQSTLALIDLEIPGATGPLDDGSWGINVAAAQTNFPGNGLQLYLLPWSGMGLGDSYKIMLNGSTQVASGLIQKAEEVNARVVTFVPSNRLTDGKHTLSYTITRFGQQPENSSPLDIMVKLSLPGGVDENGSTPGHSELTFDLPDDIINDGVDADAAKAGVPVTVHPYPNMAAGDDIKVSWGGYFVHHHPVTAAEVGQDIVVRVEEATILAAGDSDFDGLAVTFEVYDLVFNRSSDWAAEKRVVVDTGNARLDAPFVEEAVNGELDLDTLGSAPATLQIMVRRPDFEVGDKLIGQVKGSTADGDPVEYESAEVEVLTLNHVYEIPIPNAVLRRLAQVQAAFCYRRVRAGASTPSRSQFVNIKGGAVGMAAPIARDAAQGALDPDLPTTAIEIPWDDSMAAGDQITLRWIGTRADLTVYDPALPPHVITGREEANKQPITLNVDGRHLKTLEGGTLQLYFELAKDLGGSIVIRESARASLLNVGEPRAELPKPIVAGIIDDVMDPELPGTTLTVPVYPIMEIGDEVHYLWRGSKSGDLEDWITINSFTKDKPVVFNIDKEFIEGNDEGTVAASYWVIRVDGRRSDSEILDFRVGAGAAPLLPAPRVPGSEDDVLDLAEIPNGARTVVPHWLPDMTVGDHVYIGWRNEDGSKTYSDDRQITANAVGKDVTFDVPLAQVARFVGETVTVSYFVNPLVGTIKESLPLTFRVVETLAAPTISNIKDSSGAEIPPLGSTSDTSVTLSGTAPAGQQVEIFDGGTSKGLATADASGVWNHPLTQLATGAHPMTAVARYGSGEASAVRSFTVISVTAVAITQVKDSQGNPIANGGTTTDTSVTVEGTVTFS